MLFTLAAAVSNDALTVVTVPPVRLVGLLVTVLATEVTIDATEPLNELGTVGITLDVDVAVDMPVTDVAVDVAVAIASAAVDLDVDVVVMVLVVD